MGAGRIKSSVGGGPRRVRHTPRAAAYCAEATVWLRSDRGPLAVWAPAVTGAREWVVSDLPAAPLGMRQHARWRS
jgi:hypothetical protein